MIKITENITNTVRHLFIIATSLVFMATKKDEVIEKIDKMKTKEKTG